MLDSLLRPTLSKVFPDIHSSTQINTSLHQPVHRKGPQGSTVTEGGLPGWHNVEKELEAV